MSNPIVESIENFTAEWNGRGNEKADAQSFWLAFLRDVLDVKKPEKTIYFEKTIDIKGHKCFIDAMIPLTKVLIEHKSAAVDLDEPIKQSDGSMLTPYQQAKRYALALQPSQVRWIVTCNFNELRIYDLNLAPSTLSLLFDEENIQPQVIKLSDLKFNYSRLKFLVDPKDENVYPELKISKRAAQIIQTIYYKFKESYGDMSDARLDALNKICTRLVFCFYADDSGLFNRNKFRDFIRQAKDRRQALIDFFAVLDTPDDQRNPDIDPKLDAFDYVDGGLFADKNLEVPELNTDIIHFLTDKNFSWREIDPTIFGAMFESTVDQKKIRPSGMHYTSIENIHKVIDPLFLDELKNEFRDICRKQKSHRRRALEEFQNKIAALRFFDPACGSGNFLTETYISLRMLENEIFKALLDTTNGAAVCEIKVSIENFYGIEYNDFAVAVANTAMWISEHQMLRKTDSILHAELPELPLKNSARIICGNALRLDWRELVGNVDFIIGNPPFVGHQWRSKEQVADMVLAFADLEKHGKLDYVCAWFNKAADFMRGNHTRAAFVSTNSICQGESVGILWRHLFDKGIHIDFAHRTFKWTQENGQDDDDPNVQKRKKDSDIDKTAAVHCVIVGFSHAYSKRTKIIFDGNERLEAQNINGYLLNGPNVFIQNRGKPLTPDLPIMTKGSQPTDGGHLILSVEDKNTLVIQEPLAEKFIRRYIGSEDFINGKERYCLWLVHATKDDLRLPQIAMRLENVRQARWHSATKSVREAAATPHLFTQYRQPTTNYLLVPIISSERRKYIPIGFLPPNTIPNHATYTVAGADMFMFGVMESIVHAAWVRVLCGRLKSDYRYSPSIYNNFPWAAASSSQRSEIEGTAQGILDARARYKAQTLAWLYDPQTMPDELRAAHDANDRAVLAAYGFDGGMTELEMVSRLMMMYQALAEKKIDVCARL